MSAQADSSALQRLSLWRKGKLPDDSGIGYTAVSKQFADDVMAVMDELVTALAENKWFKAAHGVRDAEDQAAIDKLKADLAAEQEARHSAEGMVRDLCMGHADKCVCRSCEAVFRMDRARMP